MSTSTIEQRLVAEPHLAAANAEAGRRLRHRAIVRLTHWGIVVSVIGLMISGGGILVSHPRLYWGETGAIGAPSVIDLPIPFIIGPSVTNRPYHFFFAWGLVLSALAYVIGGLVTRHIRDDLLPEKRDLTWARIWASVFNHADASRYTVVQRLIYLGVVFVLFPAIVWTGLAMSFGMTSIFPFLATVLGGHQSARTLHFVVAGLLVVYLILHLTMIVLSGFGSRVHAMITGYLPRRRP